MTDCVVSHGCKKKKRRIITETASKISTVEVENKFTSISYLNNLLFKASNKLIVVVRRFWFISILMDKYYSERFVNKILFVNKLLEIFLDQKIGKPIKLLRVEKILENKIYSCNFDRSAPIIIRFTSKLKWSRKMNYF